MYRDKVHLQLRIDNLQKKSLRNFKMKFVPMLRNTMNNMLTHLNLLNQSY